MQCNRVVRVVEKPLGCRNAASLRPPLPSWLAIIRDGVFCICRDRMRELWRKERPWLQMD